MNLNLSANEFRFRITEKEYIELSEKKQLLQPLFFHTGELVLKISICPKDRFTFDNNVFYLEISDISLTEVLKNKQKTFGMRFISGESQVSLSIDVKSLVKGSHG